MDCTYGRIFARVFSFPLVVILFSFLFLSGCREQGPVRVGFIAGTSGRGADLGLSGRDAVQMVVERYNASGGINGRRIELVTKDDRQDPEIARMAMREMKAEGVEAIIGPMTSGMAQAIIPLINRFELPAISPTASSQLFSGYDDYFFRVTPTTHENATKLARYHIETTDIRNIAVVYDQKNRAFCEEWLKSFKAYFTTHGGEIRLELSFGGDEKRSFTDIVEDLLASGAEEVLIIANSLDSALICQQIRKIDAEISISLSDWGATERLLELGGDTVEGAVVVQTFNREYPGEKYREFRKSYIERFKREPGFPGVYAYEAADILFTVLSGKTPDQSLKEALLDFGMFQGLQGDVHFDLYGDVHRGGAFINIIHNRKFNVVKR